VPDQAESESEVHRVWSEEAKGLLKAEMKRSNMTYDALAEALTGAGTPESAANLRNKVSRGNFSAAFLLQCLHVIGVQFLHIGTGRMTTVRGRARTRPRPQGTSLDQPGDAGEP
jgi:hypothetical protein